MRLIRDLETQGVTDAPYTSWDMTMVSKTGSMIVVGSAKAQCSKAKPAELGQSHPEQPECGLKRHKGWPVLSHAYDKYSVLA
jgi:hypothetical protein